VASAAGFDAVDEGLSPPPGWLESFPSRFRLANSAAFDSLLHFPRTVFHQATSLTTPSSRWRIFCDHGSGTLIR
jgi:hypothetical protein